MTSNRQNENTTLAPRDVDRLLRRFDASFRPYGRALARRYGTDRAARLAEATRQRYATLLPESPRFRGVLNIFNTVISANALIVSLRWAMREEGLSVDETMSLLFDVADAQHRSMPRVVRWLARKVFFSRLFLWIAQRSAENVRSHPEGWTIDYRKGDGQACDWCFECSDCGAVKYLRKHGAPELAPYCNYIDFIQSRAFGLGMVNPETLGQGCGACREYFKQGRPTDVPGNLASLVDDGAPSTPVTDEVRSTGQVGAVVAETKMLG